MWWDQIRTCKIYDVSTITLSRTFVVYLGIQEASYRAMLSPVLLSKLPPTSAWLWARRQPHAGGSEGKPPTLTEPSATGLNPDAASYTPTTNVLCSDQRKTVLLQTARTIVCNSLNPRVSIELCVLFDSGSQRSYITARAVKMLALKPTGEQPLSIATFASASKQTKVCLRVNLKVHLRSYTPMLLSLYEPLASQPIDACVAQNKQFLSLDLADSSDGISRPLDRFWLLLGSSDGEHLQVVGDQRQYIQNSDGYCQAPLLIAEGSQICWMTTHVLRADALSSF